MGQGVETFGVLATCVTTKSNFRALRWSANLLWSAVWEQHLHKPHRQCRDHQDPVQTTMPTCRARRIFLPISRSFQSFWLESPPKIRNKNQYKNPTANSNLVTLLCLSRRLSTLLHTTELSLWLWETKTRHLCFYEVFLFYIWCIQTNQSSILVACLET